MANAGQELTSQFSTHVETPWLDNNHSFGKVVSDDDQKIVDSIQQNDSIEKIEIQGEFEFDADISAQTDMWNELLG